MNKKRNHRLITRTTILMNLNGEPMTNTTRDTSTTTRLPDCVTKVRMGNTILTVSSYFKQDTTAANKMMKVLTAETTSKPGNIA